jgi:hypothetical protein
MIAIKNVTLLIVDCIHLSKSFRALDYCLAGCSFDSVRVLSSINHPRVTHLIPHLDTLQKYSRFCLRELYRFFDTEFVLIAQADGFILKPEAWQDDFLGYDYIGAPWPQYDNMVGNGGFCIRSKKLMKYLAKRDPFYQEFYHPEDMYICKWRRAALAQAGFTFAPYEVAKNFSVEYGRWEGQFGFHSFQTDLSAWGGAGALAADPNVVPGV